MWQLPGSVSPPALSDASYCLVASAPSFPNPKFTLRLLSTFRCRASLQDGWVPGEKLMWGGSWGPLALGEVGALIICFGTEELLSSGQPGPRGHSLG